MWEAFKLMCDIWEVNLTWWVLCRGEKWRFPGLSGFFFCCYCFSFNQLRKECNPDLMSFLSEELRKIISERQNKGEGEPLPLTLLTSLSHRLPHYGPAASDPCRLLVQKGSGRIIDSVDPAVWYNPVAPAFHSCMVPIGVPGSMKTRTQTVNHLCTF